MSSLVLKDRYAGEAAWTEWFEICSVVGCRAEHAEKLRAEIESAMASQLVRCGFSVEDAGGDDPVSFFDSYFKLKGSREKGKPLKLYFAHRIQAEHLRMLDFVCGTLFGSRSGRVHDIVVDWISSLKGWKARIVRGEDGCRRLRWESTGESERQVEMPVDCDPAAEIDVAAVRGECTALLGRLVRKTGVEKSSAALLLYVTAQDIALTEPIVLAALGVGKSMAYRLKDRILAGLRTEMKRTEGAGDPLFGRLLLETCERSLAPSVRAALGGTDEV